MRNSRLSQRQMRIGGAVIVAVLMVGGAYFIPGFAFPHTKEANAELTDELLASYVAKDTDSDGLPDWQEALYGTDVNKADSDGDGITDGDAVKRGMLTPTALKSQLPQDQPITDADFSVPAPAAGSITDEFSKAFLQAYVAAGGGQPLSAEQQDALLRKLLADFSARAASSFESHYTIVSVHTDPNVSLNAYAASIEDALGANVIEGTDANALLQMAKLIEDNDAQASTKLAHIATANRNIASTLLAMRVPPAYAQNHLQLIQAFDALAKTTDQIAVYQKDPIGVIGALAAYPPAARAMGDGFESIATEILKVGEPSGDEPGALIVYVARIAAP